jgi:hypothetical protein
MANIRKSFNFKNGVQVDNDKFIVNPNGLVGIGTTVPTELLDVRGTVKVSGLATATDLHSTDALITGVATITNFTDGTLTISSGVITSSTGVVTFYGDGAGLINIPTSQWVDIDVGLGFTSIYNIGYVGVGTDDPRHTFQVGGNPNTVGQQGVGINSITGDIKATGVVTATTFIGNVNSNTATITNATVTKGIQAANANVTGVATITNLLEMRSSDGTPGRIDYYCESSNAHRTRVQSAPHSEYSGNVTLILPTESGDLIAGDTSSPITQDINTSGKITADELDSTRLNVTGIGTVNELVATTSAKVGTGTAFIALDTGKVGIGTMVPGSDFEVRNPGATIDVIADSGIAKIALGNTDITGQSSGEIRYGAQAETLDIVNKSTGNIRFVVDENPVGLNTGSFTWHHQSPATTLMTLTYDGRLGINNVNPTSTLSVGGGITATGNLNVGGSVSAASFSGSGALLTNIPLPDPIPRNIYKTDSGISTIRQLNIWSSEINPGTPPDPTLLPIVGLGSIGISTQSPMAGLDAKRDLGIFKRVAINPPFNGIFPTFNGVTLPKDPNSDIEFDDIYLQVGGTIKTRSIGIGGSARSGFDMGQAVNEGSAYPALILASVTDTERNAITNRVSGGSTIAGSIIYNTTSSQFQGYDGSSWSQFGSGGGGGGSITYTLPVSSPSNNARITLTGSDGSQDHVVITPGESIGISNVTSGGFTINNTGVRWNETATGIHTLSNVGIGTTNPENNTLQVDRHGILTGFGTFMAEVGVTTNINSFSINTPPQDGDFLTAEYTIHLQQSGGDTQVSKALIMQDGTTSDSQEFATMFTNAAIVSVGSSIDGGFCHLNVTPNTSMTGLTTYRFTRTTLM